MERSSRNGSNFFTHSEVSCCAYSAAVQFYDPPELSKDFTNAIDELPENYDKERYMEFIESFGTHYIKQADMGALYGQQSQVSSESWGRMTDEEISISASAGYSGIFELLTLCFSII